MARETKAERLAREAQVREAEKKALKESYSNRLMTMLERATNQNFELRVCHGAFELTDSDDPREGIHRLSRESDDASEKVLTELDWKLDIKEAAEREARRRAELRVAALSKLSAEERDVLGL